MDTEHSRALPPPAVRHLPVHPLHSPRCLTLNGEQRPTITNNDPRPAVVGTALSYRVHRAMHAPHEGISGDQQEKLAARCHQKASNGALYL